MHGPSRRGSMICAPRWGASGFLSTQMPSASSWGTYWSWQRAKSASTSRGGDMSLALMRRILPSCYAYRGKTSPGPPQGDGCESCAPAWPPLHIYGWRFPLWSRVSTSPTECPSPPARSSGRILIGPSSRNTASQTSTGSGAIAAKGGPITSCRYATAGSRGGTVSEVHPRSPAEDRTPDAQVYAPRD